ncbi:hypothetical protein E4U34_001270 [Claviceps purpurea]|nr:hypothetical protein E4U34_001270 [Claviceps purpurea]
MASITTTASITSSLSFKAEELTDIELAIFICLATDEHPILTTPAHNIDSLVYELCLLVPRVFQLTHVLIYCSPFTTPEDFASELLVYSMPPSPCSTDTPESIALQRNRLTASSSIAHCIVAINFDRVPHIIQIQVLEMLRTRRILTRGAVLPVPQRFVFIPVIEADAPGEGPHLTPHLQHSFAMSHWHDPEDGYVNIEADEIYQDKIRDRQRRQERHEQVEQEWRQQWEQQQQNQNQNQAEAWTSAGRDIERGEGTSAGDSVVRDEDEDEDTESDGEANLLNFYITEAEILNLTDRSQSVHITADMKRYQMDIISHLRMHRALQDGISPIATIHFEKLMRCLATIHDLDYVTPALAALAAKRTYLHRMRITEAENERSMQWGSDLSAVELLMDGLRVEHIIDDVLRVVAAPI